VAHAPACTLLAVSGLALSLASSARASDEVSLRIAWDAPEDCPGARALDARLRETLGGDPAELGRLGLVQARVEREPSGYRLTLAVHDGGRVSERVFDAAACADLVEAAAVAITLALQAPLASTPEPASEPRAPEPRDQAPPAEPERAHGALRWSLGAGAVLDVGSLPSPAPGLGVQGRASLGAWSLAPYGVLLASQREAVRAGGQVELGLWLAGLRGCYTVLAGTLGFAACAAFEAGRFHAQGVALSPGRSVNDPWLAPAVGLDAGWELSRALRLSVGLDAVAPLLRKQYAVNVNENVHAPSALSGRFWLGLSFMGD
jgi:hypothetical protein